MNKYTAKSGQNIYDIALILYGSIEGVFDLLVSNPELSYDTVFKTGTEVNYHKEFVVNQDIVSYLNDNNIKVKNGQYAIDNLDVRSEIKSWIEKTNQNVGTLYSSGKLEIAQTVNAALKTEKYNWDIVDTPLAASLNIVQSNAASSSQFKIDTALTPISPQDNWQTQNVKQEVLNSTQKLNFIKALTGISLNSMSQELQLANLNIMYSNGLLVTPTNEAEKETYYDNMSVPKLIIKQSGTSTAINMQIPSNCFVAFDWGDNSSLDFYHYKDATIKATHAYSDSNEHTIVMYGCTDFTNLDLSKVNGIYYALTEIYISQNFTTKFPDAKTLNKLFITKDA